MVGLSIGDHDVTFTAGSVKVSTRLLDGTYPDYRQLIPAEYPNRLHVGKDSLLDALRRVRLLVRDNTTPVRLSMRHGGVDLTVVSQEVGDASETVDADFEGEDLTIAFNPTYLIDGVEAVAGDEVLLETVDATKPATVRAAERDRLPLSPDARPRSPDPPGPPIRPVHLVSLAVTDFRNLADATIEPDPEGTTVITGRNGAGKTSLLEAVGLPGHPAVVPGLARGRPWCGAGRERAILRAETRVGDRASRSRRRSPSAGRARTQVNRQPVRRRADLHEALRVTVFSPEDIGVVRSDRPTADGSSTRHSPSSTPRRLGRPRRSTKVLRQRAALLRGRPADRLDAETATTLDVWDDRLDEAGTRLVEAREHAGRRAGAAGLRALRATGRVSRRTSGWPTRRSWAGALLEALAGARVRGPPTRACTTVGPPPGRAGARPWRGCPSRTHASQGEQRSLALALRLAAHQLATERSRARPRYSSWTTCSPNWTPGRAGAPGRAPLRARPC